MRTNALRKELAEILSAEQAERQPALRRSRPEEWLYATDVLQLIPEEKKETLLQTLAAYGWEYRQEKGWLLVKKPSPEPPEGWYEGNFGPEAACCASLLERHAGRLCPMSGPAQRMLIKAGEEGGQAYEAACRHLHRQWAENLRRGEPLPEISLRYFKG